ncbi:alpha-galactosidase [Conservatibacter flavescens]|uniref:Alpha-galactosidase n=1 Tax=Conservatibacter flavescens TaxID=28161 RepID=A0A2M8S624_9PAST|nr:alpha-galactosidase [Conservatibacter flavescens]PJG86561.1 alpha-galactosidase [Conservatibacter flavescens]
MQEYIRLTSPVNDLILRTAPYPEILYFGEHLEQFDEADILSLGRAIPNGGLDVDVPLTLAAEHGRGNFYSPTLEGHRNGMDWSPVFQTSAVEFEKNFVKLTALDPIAGLAFATEFTLDHNGVLKMRNTITNQKGGDYTLDRLGITFPLPDHAEEVMSFYGRWLREFQPNRTLLKHGAVIQENRMGRSSHEYPPILIVGEPHFSEQQGNLWGFHFAWSGNTRLRADVRIDGRRFVQFESLLFAGEIVLAEGESYTTPWLYTTYSSRGLNGMSQQFHRHVREHIVKYPRPCPRPVHLNIWEGVFFDHQVEHIIAMAEKAAEMGVERFIIDDGWFIGRNDDFGGLGDWYLDENKYPQGLNPVINRVHELGMEFGIWVELEMINKPTKLYQAHPDWLLEIKGYDQPEERHQYTLDLQNPQVFDYLLERMNWLLGEHKIDYIKWDMNRRIVQPGHNGRSSLDGQTRAMYRLHDEIRKRHPHVEIEACASGGGRIDYEILKRTQRFWTSDNTEALERQKIQRGMSYFFPPETMGAHISSPQNCSTGRTLDLQFRGLTALFGHMGVELDPVKEAAEKAGFAKYIALHKSLRTLLHSGNVVRVDTRDETQLIHGVVAQDQSEAIFCFVQLAMPEYLLPGIFKVPELQPNATYRVHVLDLPTGLRNGTSGHLMKKYPQWLQKALQGESLEFTGEWLTKVGLTLIHLDPATAILFKFERV